MKPSNPKRRTKCPTMDEILAPVIAASRKVKGKGNAILEDRARRRGDLMRSEANSFRRAARRGNVKRALALLRKLDREDRRKGIAGTKP